MYRVLYRPTGAQHWTAADRRFRSLHRATTYAQTLPDARVIDRAGVVVGMSIA